MERVDAEEYVHGYEYGCHLRAIPGASYSFLLMTLDVNPFTRSYRLGVHRAIKDRYPEHKIPEG